MLHIVAAQQKELVPGVHGLHLDHPKAFSRVARALYQMPLHAVAFENPGRAADEAEHSGKRQNESQVGVDIDHGLATPSARAVITHWYCMHGAAAFAA